jgi:FMN-dependent dehydrogenase
VPPWGVRAAGTSAWFESVVEDLPVLDAGATAISASDHGGDTLDGTPASNRALPAVAHASAVGWRSSSTAAASP